MKNGERSILIVEDESPVRALLMELLGKQFHCQAADTAEAAIRLLNSQRFHLVLADIGLPGTSGLELCRTIAARSRQATNRAKSLMLHAACTTGARGPSACVLRQFFDC